MPCVAWHAGRAGPAQLREWPTMHVLAMQTAAEGAGQLEKIASTFGVNWHHLLSQIVSFGIVCVVLYLLAYKPILRILEARRQQIAGGLANAEKIKAELARIEAERLGILRQADGEGKQLIEEARAVAARVQAEETRKAIAAAEQIVVRAHEAAERDRATMLAELKHEVGRLVVQTTASVAGKILTPEDHRRLAEETARHFMA
jgi:F-type H+-transporting ATPase subunit b